MDRWEYLTINLETAVVSAGKGFFSGSTWNTESISSQLNEYGQHGWELVGFFYRESTSSSGSWGTENTFATFKRKIQL